MAGRELSTREGLISALENGRQEILGFFGGLPAEVFFEGSAQQWSPAHHVDHLTRSNGPVAQVLGMPRLALAAFGGAKTRFSRSFEELRDTYRAALASGGRASRRYLPDLSGQGQEQIVRAFEAASGQVVQALDRWKETDLDRHQLPHPLLGPLTVRELLFFTLYHNGHHLNGVRARQSGPHLAPAAPPR